MEEQKPPDEARNTSIRALSIRTKKKLSDLLNPVKIIPTDEGLPRDWQGLAELCNVGGEKLSMLHNHKDASNTVLQLWFENNANEATVDNLLCYLEKLDRFDIIDDITELIDTDIITYNNHSPVNGVVRSYPLSIEADRSILTDDDVERLQNGLGLMHYDAFVLFADDDIKFATELIDTLEKEYNLQLFVKDRNLNGGTFEISAIKTLIAERCDRLIVIFSDAFFSSTVNEFYLSYTEALQINRCQRKIIPCIYKPLTNPPPELSFYHMLDYRRKMFNFWDLLNKSIIDTKSLNKEAKNSLSAIDECKERKTSNSTLRPVRNMVKFNSMQDLNSDKILTETCITPGPSTSSLEVYAEDPKKFKTKKSWKLKFWKRHNKRTAAPMISS